MKHMALKTTIIYVIFFKIKKLATNNLISVFKHYCNEQIFDDSVHMQALI